MSCIFCEFYREEYFWSRSFCLLTTGGVSIEVVKRYIESQGEK